MREVVLGTFGFGYNLDSLLLRDIADEGNGAYVVARRGIAWRCDAHAKDS